MKTKEEVREEILQAALAELKAKAGEVIQDVMGGLYTDYLPHVETDTESNIDFRVKGAIKNLISGKFEQYDESTVRVSDGYGVEHYIRLNSYSSMVGPLCNQMSEAIKGARIAQLEQEVGRLNAHLVEAYRRA